jgi:hypothetical protein
MSLVSTIGRPGLSRSGTTGATVRTVHGPPMLAIPGLGRFAEISDVQVTWIWNWCAATSPSLGGMLPLIV